MHDSLTPDGGICRLLTCTDCQSEGGRGSSETAFRISLHVAPLLGELEKHLDAEVCNLSERYAPGQKDAHAPLEGQENPMERDNTE